jgi:hypothetical protein
MNIAIYIAIAIIVILIIFYFCFKQNLIQTQSTTITVSDGFPLNHACLYNKTTKIIFCHYIASNNKKFVFTDMINSVLSNWNSQDPFIFKSEDYNLPKNGILKIRFICNFIKNNFENLNVSHSSTIIPINSSSTQNPIYSGNTNESYFLKQINTAKKENQLYTVLNNIENAESNYNSIKYSKKNNYFDNIFNRKYPYTSITSKLANIDPEYIIGGLRGDARLLS